MNTELEDRLASRTIDDAGHHAPRSTREPTPRIPAGHVVVFCTRRWDLRSFVTKRISAIGASPMVVTNLPDCLRWISKTQPDLVVVDIDAARDDSLSLLRAIIEVCVRETPILCVSRQHDPERAARALDLGATEYITRPVAPAELEARIRRALRTKHHIDALTQCIRVDPLTGIGNRRAFDDALERAVADWRRHRRPFALCLIDVDEFKKINDHHGHQAGDAVLRRVARLLARSCRPTDEPCRFGGDEFAILLRDTTRARAKRAIDRLRGLLHYNEIATADTVVSFGASLGTASADDLGPGVESREVSDQIIDLADRNLYAAKRSCTPRLRPRGHRTPA